MVDVRPDRFASRPMSTSNVWHVNVEHVFGKHKCWGCGRSVPAPHEPLDDGSCEPIRLLLNDKSDNDASHRINSIYDHGSLHES